MVLIWTLSLTLLILLNFALMFGTSRFVIRNMSRTLDLCSQFSLSSHAVSLHMISPRKANNTGHLNIIYLATVQCKLPYQCSAYRAVQNKPTVSDYLGELDLRCLVNGLSRCTSRRRLRIYHQLSSLIQSCVDKGLVTTRNFLANACTERKNFHSS